MKHRSLFGPLLLIAIGTLWILNNAGRIEPASLWALAYAFPYMLILLGLGLIVRSYWAWAGEVVSVLVVVLGVLAVLYAPQLGWARAPVAGSFPFISIGPGKPATGEMSVATPAVSDFKQIRVGIPADVVITQGATESLKIEAQSDVLAALEIKVSGGELYIGYPGDDWGDYVMPTDDVRITITVKNLNAVTFSTAGTLDLARLETDSLTLTISGAGDMTVNDLDAGTLECVLSGAGSVKASGKVDELTMRISGMGSIDAPNLQTNTATIRISGAGSANLWVVKELNANISGAGSVNYFGNPTVSQTISGAGSINRRGEK
jgi:hypothetical protein